MGPTPRGQPRSAPESGVDRARRPPHPRQADRNVLADETVLHRGAEHGPERCEHVSDGVRRRAASGAPGGIFLDVSARERPQRHAAELRQQVALEDAAVAGERASAQRGAAFGQPGLRVRRRCGSRTDGCTAREPAVVWPDQSGRWYWHGIAVPAKLAANRDNLSAEQIVRIDNQELRRLALERLGWQRFLETADAELRAQDDYGKLWSTQIRLDGEHAQVVEVVNATPEPDGTHRRYFLRVPPRMSTAREAVAWTFGYENSEQFIVTTAS